MVQEPNNNRGKIQYLGKHFVVHGARNGGNNRAAIITTPGFDCWTLNQFCNNDQATIAFSTNNKTTVVSSIYMPYVSEEPPPALLTSNLVSFCERKNWNLIIGTDANSHHIAWGSTNNNNRGEKLLDFIVSTDLQICNVGNVPTFRNAVREEVIDLTLATTQASNKISDWKVNPGNTISDHNRISFRYNTELEPKNPNSETLGRLTGTNTKTSSK